MSLTREYPESLNTKLFLFPLRVLHVLPESSQAQPGYHRLHRLEGVDGLGEDGGELDGDEGEDDGEVEQVSRHHGRQQTEMITELAEMELMVTGRLEARD